MYIQLAPPSHTRGGIFFPIEGDRWVVTLLGACQDYPPTDVTAGPSPAIGLLYRYMDAVLLAATIDEGIADTFLRVLNMMDSPAALRRPTTMLRVVRQARRARQIGPVLQPLMTSAS